MFLEVGFLYLFRLKTLFSKKYLKRHSLHELSHGMPQSIWWAATGCPRVNSESVWCCTSTYRSYCAGLKNVCIYPGLEEGYVETSVCEPPTKNQRGIFKFIWMHLKCNVGGARFKLREPLVAVELSLFNSQFTVHCTAQCRLSLEAAEGPGVLWEHNSLPEGPLSARLLTEFFDKSALPGFFPLPSAPFSWRFTLYRLDRVWRQNFKSGAMLFCRHHRLQPFRRLFPLTSKCESTRAESAASK